MSDNDQYDDVVNETTNTESAPEPTAEVETETQVKTPAELPTSKSVDQEHAIYQTLTGGEFPKYATPLNFTPTRVGNIDFNSPEFSVGEKDLKLQDKRLTLGRIINGIEQQMLIRFDNAPFFQRTLDDEGALWKQDIVYNNTRIGLNQPKIKPPKEQRNFAGFAAADIISNVLGTGISVRVQLPHTGISVKLQARSDADVLAFQYQQNIAAVHAGNDAEGIIHQNSHIGTVERVWDFIRASITWTNLEGWNTYDLGDIIPVTELTTFYWAQACTFYPNGYPMDLNCASGINKCNHVESVKLNLRKIAWTNSQALSNVQLTRLSTPDKNFTFEQVKEYQTVGKTSFTRTITLNDRIKVYLRVPTINEYISAGKEWISACTQTARRIFSDKESDIAKVRDYVAEEISLNSVREYSHWIDYIEVDGLSKIDGRDEIANNLEQFSSHEEISKLIFVELQRFIEDCTVLVVALPNFACPVCQTDYATDEHSKHPELVVLDMLKLFFHLADRRLLRPSLSQML